MEYRIYMAYCPRCAYPVRSLTGGYHCTNAKCKTEYSPTGESKQPLTVEAPPVEASAAQGVVGVTENRYYEALVWIRRHAEQHGNRCPLCTHDHGGHYNGCLLDELKAQPGEARPSLPSQPDLGVVVMSDDVKRATALEIKISQLDLQREGLVEEYERINSKLFGKEKPTQEAREWKVRRSTDRPDCLLVLSPLNGLPYGLETVTVREVFPTPPALPERGIREAANSTRFFLIELASKVERDQGEDWKETWNLIKMHHDALEAALQGKGEVGNGNG